MSPAFESARALHARGKWHLGFLTFERSGYINKQPYTIIREHDPETGLNLWKAKVVVQPDPQMACMVFDAVNCFRSALDHAVFAAVQKIGGVADPDSTKFPFGDSYKEAEEQFEGRARRVPASIRDFLLDFKPYKGGNDLLWGFNKIRNSKIHRILAPT